MKMRILLSLIIVALLSVSAMAIPEAMDIEVNVMSAPYGGPSDGSVFGQGFEPTMPLLTAVEIRYYGYESLPLVAQMDIRTWVNPAEGLPTDAPILGSKTEIFTTPMTYADPETWIRWTFDTPIAVVPGNKYVLYYTPLSGSMGTGHSMTDVYDGGYQIVSFGHLAPGNWNQYYGQDMAIRTYGTPEPATIALLGLGGLALLRKKRS